MSLEANVGMPVAYVLINCETGYERDVAERVGAIEGVREVYMVFGAFDLVVKVEADDLGRVREVVTGEIRRVPRVRSTLTLVVIK